MDDVTPVQLGFIGKLMRLQPPRFLFGGWAEDALLHGKPSRPHEDIDLLVPLQDLDAVVGQAQAMGFDDFRVKFQVEEGKPIVVAGYAEGVELELIVFQSEEDGTAFFDLPVGEQLQRVWLPQDAFAQPPSRLSGIEVRTLSPLALYHIREFSKDVFGGLRDKDRATQAALKQRFFRDTPERQLQPRRGPPP